jgi:uncharacterized protein
MLIAGILLISATSARRFSAPHASVHRLADYGTTAALELAMLAWVIFGLRLQKLPFRLLLGENSLRLRSVALDFGIAILFWFGSLMVLGTLAIAWLVAQSLITHHSLLSLIGAPDPSQQHAVRTLAQLAPSNAVEAAAWVLLCVIAGFVEECVFRGYLQRQFIAWARGSAAAGVVFSALVFGAAHAYEGARAMFLIAVFGALFSLLALFRGSLRPGMIAHCAQDLAAGLALAWFDSHHLV